jgi:spore coat protein A
MTNTSRRTFIGLAGAAVAGAAVYGAVDVLGGQANASTTGPNGLVGGSAPLDGPSTPQFTALEPFRDPLRIPPTLRPAGQALTEVQLVNRQIRLHSQLPPTPMWTYDGCYPGPTIEVERDQKVRIAWQNNLQGLTPVKSVFVPPVGPLPGFAAYNTPGAGGAPARPEITALTPWISTHLHGAHQNSTNDGMADCGVIPGSAQLAEYPNDVPGAHLFYHDHAMPITAVNVMSGLMGNYILRDPKENRINLPKGNFEIPLTLADVNFDTDDQGRLTGQLLVKRIQLGPAAPGQLPVSVSSQGPYNMVNGVIFPYLDVQATAYRFRLLNVATSRAYRLAVIDEQTGQLVRGVLRVVGTDLGLLDKPKVIDEALSLASAERVDIVIDFAAFAGRRLQLVNTVDGVPAGTPVPDAAVAFPQVMQFRVAQQQQAPYALPAKLSPDFRAITPADLPADVTERFVMLILNTQAMPQLKELQEVPASTPVTKGIVQLALPGGTRTFQMVATRFEDPPTFYGAAGSVEKWTIINVANPELPVTHPIHVHMLNFQLLDRHAVDGSAFDTANLSTFKPIGLRGQLPIAPEESGVKDTVAVPVNTMVTIAGRLGVQTGRFMYHCHILDHEDEGMMRPFMIMPTAVLNMQNLMMTMNGPAMGSMAMGDMNMGH